MQIELLIAGFWTVVHKIFDWIQFSTPIRRSKIKSLLKFVAYRLKIAWNGWRAVQLLNHACHVYWNPKAKEKLARFQRSAVNHCCGPLHDRRQPAACPLVKVLLCCSQVNGTELPSGSCQRERQFWKYSRSARFDRYCTSRVQSKIFGDHYFLALFKFS